MMHSAWCETSYETIVSYMAVEQLKLLAPWQWKTQR